MAFAQATAAGLLWHKPNKHDNVRLLELFDDTVRPELRRVLHFPYERRRSRLL